MTSMENLTRSKKVEEGLDMKETNARGGTSLDVINLGRGNVNPVKLDEIMGG